MDIEDLIKRRLAVGDVVKGPGKGRFRFEGIKRRAGDGYYARFDSLTAKAEDFGYDVDLEVLATLVDHERRKPGGLRPATDRFHTVLERAGIEPPAEPYTVDTTYVAVAEFLARPLSTLEPDTSFSDTDEWAEDPVRQVRARRGQARFRQKLRDQHGPRCMASGCKVWDIIEAAHIIPYAEAPNHRASNGLLLRADIHTLFDLDLLRIEPDKLTIHVASRLRSTEYAPLHGKKLRVKKSKKLQANLRWRWER